MPQVFAKETYCQESFIVIFILAYLKTHICTSTLFSHMHINQIAIVYSEPSCLWDMNCWFLLFTELWGSYDLQNHHTFLQFKWNRFQQ